MFKITILLKSFSKNGLPLEIDWYEVYGTGTLKPGEFFKKKFGNLSLVCF
jgi:hypothetical protein